MADVLLTSLSGASARLAVFEQTGASTWLYLTAPGDFEPVASCFLYATGEPAAGDGAPPPIDPQYASGYTVEPPVTEDDVELLWSPKGDAVAARIKGEIVGFISAEESQESQRFLLGYSRSVGEECAWGHPFDVPLFQRLFDVG